MGKASLWSVPADHFRTLYDNRTGRPDWWAIVWQAILPLGTGVAVWKLGAKMAEGPTPGSWTRGCLRCER